MISSSMDFVTDVYCSRDENTIRNGMAKAGMNYEEILQYFYNDVKLETMK